MRSGGQTRCRLRRARSFPPGRFLRRKPPAPARRRRRWAAWALLGLAILAAVAGGAYWWHARQAGLPLGIVSGNGRIEADEIDIDTKFAGRIAEMLADEGDMVKVGQVLARMDTQDLAAQLKKSEAQVQQAQRGLDEAHSNVDLQKTQLTLAQQEFDRTNALVKNGFATYELLDQRRQALNGAIAALKAANDRVGEAERALDAATHDVELYKVDIADNTLVAPRDGRIQYRIANIGEVLPAGGRVFTMLDILYVYMDIYLPTADAGKVKIGADARIVLDARPDLAIPGEGRLHRDAGAVHPQDGGDQGRARQADVPHQGENRSRSIARARVPR